LGSLSASAKGGRV